MSLHGRRAGRASRAPIDFKEGDARRARRHARSRRLASVVERFDDEQQPYLSLVLPDVEDPLRRLRPSRPRQGMVAPAAKTRRRRMSARASFRRRRCACRSRRPIRRSRPGSSANAGSGKTHVLAQRVIRLLLDGVDPAKILCITFTKAAAANMANRVFDTLGAMDRARRRGARRGDRRDLGRRARRATRARGRGGCSPGAGDAGRPEGADHPRLLHAAAASVSVRGRRRGALRGAGRARREAQLLDRVCARACCSKRRAQPESRSGARSRPRSPRPPTRPSRR